MCAQRSLVQATVLGVNDVSVLYPSCIRCYAKMLHNVTNNSWQCLRCNVRCQERELNWRYRLSLCVGDSSSTCNISLFGGTLVQHFGCGSNQFHRILQGQECGGGKVGDDTLLHALEDALVGNTFIFCLKAGLPPPPPPSNSTTNRAINSSCKTSSNSRKAETQESTNTASRFVNVNAGVTSNSCSVIAEAATSSNNNRKAETQASTNTTCFVNAAVTANSCNISTADTTSATAVVKSSSNTASTCSKNQDTAQPTLEANTSTGIHTSCCEIAKNNDTAKPTTPEPQPIILPKSICLGDLINHHHPCPSQKGDRKTLSDFVAVQMIRTTVARGDGGYRSVFDVLKQLLLQLESVQSGVSLESVQSGVLHGQESVHSGVSHGRESVHTGVSHAMELVQHGLLHGSESAGIVRPELSHGLESVHCSPVVKESERTDDNSQIHQRVNDCDKLASSSRCRRRESREKFCACEDQHGKCKRKTSSRKSVSRRSNSQTNARQRQKLRTCERRKLFSPHGNTDIDLRIADDRSDLECQGGRDCSQRTDSCTCAENPSAESESTETAYKTHHTQGSSSSYSPISGCRLSKNPARNSWSMFLSSQESASSQASGWFSCQDSFDRENFLDDLSLCSSIGTLSQDPVRKGSVNETSLRHSTRKSYAKRVSETTQRESRSFDESFLLGQAEISQSEQDENMEISDSEKSSLAGQPEISEICDQDETLGISDSEFRKVVTPNIQTNSNMCTSDRNFVCEQDETLGISDSEFRKVSMPNSQTNRNASNRNTLALSSQDFETEQNDHTFITQEVFRNRSSSEVFQNRSSAQLDTSRPSLNASASESVLSVSLSLDESSRKEHTIRSQEIFRNRSNQCDTSRPSLNASTSETALSVSLSLDESSVIVAALPDADTAENERFRNEPDIKGSNSRTESERVANYGSSSLHFGFVETTNLTIMPDSEGLSLFLDNIAPETEPGKILASEHEIGRNSQKGGLRCASTTTSRHKKFQCSTDHHHGASVQKLQRSTENSRQKSEADEELTTENVLCGNGTMLLMPDSEGLSAFLDDFSQTEDCAKEQAQSILETKANEETKPCAGMTTTENVLGSNSTMLVMPDSEGMSAFLNNFSQSQDYEKETEMKATDDKEALESSKCAGMTTENVLGGNSTMFHNGTTLVMPDSEGLSAFLNDFDSQSQDCDEHEKEEVPHVLEIKQTKRETKGCKSSEFACETNETDLSQNASNTNKNNVLLGAGEDDHEEHSVLQQQNQKQGQQQHLLLSGQADLEETSVLQQKRQQQQQQHEKQEQSQTEEAVSLVCPEAAQGDSDVKILTQGKRNVHGVLQSYVRELSTISEISLSGSSCNSSEHVEHANKILNNSVASTSSSRSHRVLTHNLSNSLSFDRQKAADVYQKTTKLACENFVENRHDPVLQKTKKTELAYEDCLVENRSERMLQETSTQLVPDIDFVADSFLDGSAELFSSQTQSSQDNTVVEQEVIDNSQNISPTTTTPFSSGMYKAGVGGQKKLSPTTTHFSSGMYKVGVSGQKNLSPTNTPFSSRVYKDKGSNLNTNAGKFRTKRIRSLERDSPNYDSVDQFHTSTPVNLSTFARGANRSTASREVNIGQREHKQSFYGTSDEYHAHKRSSTWTPDVICKKRSFTETPGKYHGHKRSITGTPDVVCKKRVRFSRGSLVTSVVDMDARLEQYQSPQLPSSGLPLSETPLRAGTATLLQSCLRQSSDPALNFSAEAAPASSTVPRVSSTPTGRERSNSSISNPLGRGNEQTPSCPRQSLVPVFNFSAEAAPLTSTVPCMTTPISREHSNSSISNSSAHGNEQTPSPCFSQNAGSQDLFSSSLSQEKDLQSGRVSGNEEKKMLCSLSSVSKENAFRNDLSLGNEEKQVCCRSSVSKENSYCSFSGSDSKRNTNCIISSCDSKQNSCSSSCSSKQHTCHGDSKQNTGSTPCGSKENTCHCDSKQNTCFTPCSYKENTSSSRGSDQTSYYSCSPSLFDNSAPLFSDICDTENSDVENTPVVHVRPCHCDTDEQNTPVLHDHTSHCEADVENTPAMHKLYPFRSGLIAASSTPRTTPKTPLMLANRAGIGNFSGRKPGVVSTPRAASKTLEGAGKAGFGNPSGSCSMRRSVQNRAGIGNFSGHKPGVCNTPTLASRTLEGAGKAGFGNQSGSSSLRRSDRIQTRAGYGCFSGHVASFNTPSAASTTLEGTGKAGFGNPIGSSLRRSGYVRKSSLSSNAFSDVTMSPDLFSP